MAWFVWYRQFFETICSGWKNMLWRTIISFIEVTGRYAFFLSSRAKHTVWNAPKIVCCVVCGVCSVTLEKSLLGKSFAHYLFPFRLHYMNMGQRNVCVFAGCSCSNVCQLDLTWQNKIIHHPSAPQRNFVQCFYSVVLCLCCWMELLTRLKHTGVQLGIFYACEKFPLSQSHSPIHTKQGKLQTYTVLRR